MSGTKITLLYLHLATVVPCFFIGALLLIIKKGTDLHKKLGRVYMILMLFTASVNLFMPAEVGSRIVNHFGWIHNFSFLTIYPVPTAYLVLGRKHSKIKNVSFCTLCL